MSIICSWTSVHTAESDCPQQLVCKIQRGGLIKAMCSHAWKSILRLCVLYLFISDTQLEKEEEEKKYKKVPFK